LPGNIPNVVASSAMKADILCLVCLGLLGHGVDKSSRPVATLVAEIGLARGCIQ